MPSPPKAVCLLSGGLDSATCLALARREGYACYALSFDYGQRHSIELEAAARVAAHFGAARHLVAKIGLDAFGGSALTADIAVPKGALRGGNERTAFPSPTCRRATPSFFRSRWPGRKCWKLAISSSA